MWIISRRPAPPSRFYSRPAFSPEATKNSKVHRPIQDYSLFEGPLVAVGELGALVSWDPGGERSFERHTPSLLHGLRRDAYFGPEYREGIQAFLQKRPPDFEDARARAGGRGGETRDAPPVSG
jgi:hypothetical protein